MKFSGGCYCGQVRYEAEGDPLMRGQCHCRECQYISGGSANVIIAMPRAGFHYTGGQPKRFVRDDLENGVVREFCENCGTSLTSNPPGMPDIVIIKVGTMDDPSEYGEPEMALYCVEKQKFHYIPDGLMTFDRFPG
ncbi:MAG: GFA family protein [Halioglobus sp.]